MKDMLQPTDEAILQCIAQGRGITTEDIFTSVYNNSQTQKWQMYRRIKFLENFGYIASKLLYPEKGNSSPKYYILRAKGAYAVGLEKVPPNQYRYLNRDFYRFKQTKIKLEAMAHTMHWILATDERSKRRHIAESFKRHAYLQGYPVAPEHIYMQTVPLEVAPELVLETHQEVFILIICHPFAGEDAFRKKIDKYFMLLTDIRFICICPRQEQVKQFEHIIKGKSYENNFILVSFDRLEDMKQLLL